MGQPERLLTEDELARPFRTGGCAEQFPPILAPTQLAGLLGLSRKTIDDWVAKGRLQGCCRKRGKHLLIWRDKTLDMLFNAPTGGVRMSKPERVRVGERVSIYTRGPKRIWCADFWHEGVHRRQYLRTADKRVVLQRAIQIEARLAAGSYQAPPAVTVRQAADDYLAYVDSEHRARKPITKYKGFVRAAFRNFWPSRVVGRKPLLVNGLAPTGWPGSAPAEPGPGGVRPGQILDKFRAGFRAGAGPLAALSLAAASVALGAAVPRRDRPRTRREPEAERLARREQALGEVRRIAAEFHARLPRERAAAVGAISVRYSTRFQDSLADQARALFEAAVRENVFVPVEHAYFDLASRGVKAHREGLDRLREALAAGGVRVLLVFGTNRLFRKTYKALQFVEEEVVERGIRCLFVKTNIDTADEKRWRSTLHLHAVLDELGAGMYADNIRAAQEGLFDRGVVFGTVSFGYAGEPLPGELTRRKLPRRRLVVDPAVAPWVQRIFTWFAAEGLPIDEVVRRLNAAPDAPDAPDAPLPPRATSGHWTRLAVRTVLRNPRYRGWWEYGKRQSVWQPSKDYARQVERASPLRGAQVEDLRIVPDELWYAAQRRLQELGTARRGRKPAGGDARRRPKLLNGLFRCPGHDRPLYVAGADGGRMACPACLALPGPAGPLYSQLNRELAVRLTCEKLAELVRQDEQLVNAVVEACRKEADAAQGRDDTRLDELRRLEQKLTTRVKFVLGNAGDSEADQQEAADELKRLRLQRAQAREDIARLEGPAAVLSGCRPSRKFVTCSAAWAGSWRTPGRRPTALTFTPPGRSSAC